MRWKRTNNWKVIRHLVDDAGHIHASIQRGRRPNEYTIVFAGAQSQYVRGKWHEVKEKQDYVLNDSTLAVAKAVGLLLVKTN